MTPRGRNNPRILPKAASSVNAPRRKCRRQAQMSPSSPSRDVPSELTTGSYGAVLDVRQGNPPPRSRPAARSRNPKSGRGRPAARPPCSAGQASAARIPQGWTPGSALQAKLQRQAAGQMRGEIEKSQPVEARPAYRREIGTRLVVQRQPAGKLRVGGQARRERLGDRPDLEQRRILDRPARRFRSDAESVHVMTTAHGHAGRHTRNAVSFHDRSNGPRHERSRFTAR